MKKLVALGLGIAIALVGLEIFLRLLGISQFDNSRVKNLKADPSKFTIVCHGDSIAAGIGAQPGRSYCDQLLGKIESDPTLSTGRFRTINLARPSLNSFTVLRELDQVIDQYQPQLVVVLVGAANVWNRMGYSEFFKRSESSGVWTRFVDLAFESRVFKLTSFLYRQSGRHDVVGSNGKSLFFFEVPADDYRTLAYKYLAGFRRFESEWTERAQIQEALTSLEKFSETPEGKVRPVYNLLGWLNLFKSRNVQVAAGWFEKSVALDPESFDIEAYFYSKTFILNNPNRDFPELQEIVRLTEVNYPGDKLFGEMARELLLPNWEKLVKSDSGLSTPRISMLEKLNRSSPLNDRVAMELHKELRQSGQELLAVKAVSQAFRFNPFNFMNLAGELETISQETKDREIKTIISQAFDEVKKKFPNYDNEIRPALDESLVTWLESDLREIGRTLKRRGVGVLFQTYPPLRNGLARNIDDIIPRVAREEGIPLSDTYGYFSQKFTNAAEREPYFSSMYGPHDNHLSEKGYALMADILLQSIKSQGIFSEKAR